MYELLKISWRENVLVDLWGVADLLVNASNNTGICKFLG